jgi:hypothetical protein
VGRRGRASVAVVFLAFLLPGCGGDDKRYADDRIVERLHLEEVGDDFAIDGDPFCAVERRLLNDAEEVDDVTDEDDVIVVASREGNVGVEGVAPFAHDCADTARKRLNKLDPAPKED